MKNPKGLQAFATHLRRIREARNLSQQELADLADVDKKTIQRVENVQFRVTLDVLLSIAKGLEVPLTDLTNFIVPKEKVRK